MKPLVSIVIPTYNRQDLIKECLDSLVRQTYGNWEAIVIDDRSSDDTVQLLEQLSQNDPRIKFEVKGPEIVKGAASSRNIGIKKAKGEFLIFLDSDDILADFCLSQRVEVLKENADVDFVVFQGLFFEKISGDTNICWNLFTDEDDLNRFLRGDVVWSITGPIWRKKFFDSNSIYFDERRLSSQDWELHIKALSIANMYKKSGCKPDYFIRRDEGVERISGGHYSITKMENRLSLLRVILQIVQRKHRRNLKVLVVRETIFAIARNPDFRLINYLISSGMIVNPIEKGFWKMFFRAVIFSKQQNLKSLYLNCYRFLNLVSPKYLKKYKTYYRSVYSVAENE